MTAILSGMLQELFEVEIYVEILKKFLKFGKFILTNETCRKIAAKKQRDHGQVTIQFRIQNSLISSR